MDINWSHAEKHLSRWVFEWDMQQAAEDAAAQATEEAAEQAAEQATATQAAERAAEQAVAEQMAAAQVLVGDVGGPGTESAHGAINLALRKAETAQSTTARSMAVEVGAAAEVIRLARNNLRIYLTPGGMSESDALELAERAAATDLGLRLKRSPDQVRTMAHEGLVLAESLPQLWALFKAGHTGYAQARAAVNHLTGLTDPEVIAHYDTELAQKAAELTAEAFQRKARVLQQRLLAEPPELRHARAMADRRVVIEPANDGMCTVFAVISAADGIRINARLDATAKRISKKEAKEAKAAGTGRDRCRTRAQIRTDLFASWLAGDGTPTAAKVRPMLFVPVHGLLGGTDSATQASRAGQASSAGTGGHLGRVGQGGHLDHDGIDEHAGVAGRDGHSAGEADPAGQAGQPVPFDQPAVLQGYGPIDPVTAAQLFIDAPAFRRVGTDPFTGEILSFDRTRYRPTKAQREWLAVKYGTCARTGCNRLAVSSDVDHLKEWVRDHGLTNEDNLIPLCPPDHRLKTLTKIRYKRDPDGSVTVTTPTGYVGINAPPDPLPRHPLLTNSLERSPLLRKLRESRRPLPENPPF